MTAAPVGIGEPPLSLFGKNSFQQLGRQVEQKLAVRHLDHSATYMKWRRDKPFNF